MDQRDLYKLILVFVLCIVSYHCISQESAVRCINPEFDKKIEGLLSNTIPVISVADAYESRNTFLFLDAREKEEYSISHIKNAVHIGYDHFQVENHTNIKKDTPIIVYCSIGYRSGKVSEQLISAGFTNVQNLYGSIFEWVNQHHPIVDNKGIQTHQIHTYNKNWSKWVEPENLKKVW